MELQEFSTATPQLTGSRMSTIGMDQATTKGLTQQVSESLLGAEPSGTWREIGVWLCVCVAVCVCGCVPLLPPPRRARTHRITFPAHTNLLMAVGPMGFFFMVDPLRHTSYVRAPKEFSRINVCLAVVYLVIVLTYVIWSPAPPCFCFAASVRVFCPPWGLVAQV